MYHKNCAPSFIVENAHRIRYSTCKCIHLTCEKLEMQRKHRFGYEIIVQVSVTLDNN